jgi:hypothetical protein
MDRRRRPRRARRLSGDQAAGQRKVREADRLFTEMGATIPATQVAKEFGSPTAS